MSDTNTYQSDQIRSWIGYTAVDVNGDKVGKIEDVYEDDRGSGPEWFAIATGLFGTKRSIAPVAGSRADGDRLVLPWTKDQIKNGPNFDDGDIDDASGVYGHYGMGYDDDDRYDGTETTRSGSATGSAVGTTGRGLGTETGTGNSTGDGSDSAMTRSEEEVDVHTRTREAGRARLRKWVETEDVQVTVPVRRQVARVVTEPITEANRDAALRGPEITENEYDVVLNEEEVVVDKQVVPKERVRLETDTVEDERVVDEQVRKERIAMDDDNQRSDVRR